MSDRGICFVISPIGKEGSESRQRSDKILKHVITPVADACGYDALRADKISEPGMITTQVINHVINADIVVADLTGENANVFYELAVRHAAHKPYVQLIEKGQKIPFDLAGIRTIEIDLTDLDSVDDAKVQMKKQIEGSKLGAAKTESPISIAIDFDRLRRSDDPVKREVADLLQAISELRVFVQKDSLRREATYAKLFNYLNSPKTIYDTESIERLHLVDREISGLQKRLEVAKKMQMPDSQSQQRQEAELKVELESLQAKREQLLERLLPS